METSNSTVTGSETFSTGRMNWLYRRNSFLNRRSSALDERQPKGAETRTREGRTRRKKEIRGQRLDGGIMNEGNGGLTSMILSRIGMSYIFRSSVFSGTSVGDLWFEFCDVSSYWCSSHWTVLFFWNLRSSHWYLHLNLGEEDEEEDGDEVKEQRLLIRLCTWSQRAGLVQSRVH